MTAAASSGQAGPRIVLDARFIGFAGIGRMVAGLWRGLVELGAEVIGLWPKGAPRDWMGPHRAQPLGRHIAIGARPFWPAEQLVLPAVLRRVGAAVHHAPNFSVPYLTTHPVVLTVHDLFPYLDRANARSPLNGAVYQAIVPLAIRRARRIVAVSPFAAQQVREAFDVPEERLRVVEHGIDHDRWHEPGEERVALARARYALPHDYLLYVGTLKRHKNLGTVIGALTDSHPPLVLAGPTPQELASSHATIGDEHRLMALGRVPDSDLAALYAGAIALVLPSVYEAVGFTALEAMACGTAVVSSDGGGLPHTVGDAGLLVAPRDQEAWREALTTITEQPDLRRTLAEAGKARVAHRDWRRAAGQYMDVYREAAA